MPRSGFVFNLGLAVLLSLALILFVNLRRWSRNGSFEPWEDNLLALIVLVVIYSAAALAIAAHSAVWGRRKPVWLDSLRFAVTGAVGSALLMVLLDWWDDYFSGEGIGLVFPLTGVVLGASFGFPHRWLRHWTDQLPNDRPSDKARPSG